VDEELSVRPAGTATSSTSAVNAYSLPPRSAHLGL
jgi:hypothetical protein